VKSVLLIPFEKVVHYVNSRREVAALCVSDLWSILSFHLYVIFREIWQLVLNSHNDGASKAVAVVVVVVPVAILLAVVI